MTAAVVLAGGQGTRLGQLTARIPKSMIPVAGRPFLEHLATQLLDVGLCPVVVTIHPLADVIRDHFGGQRQWADLRLVATAQAGTGADLIECLGHVPTNDFVAWNGDTVVDLDIPALLARFAEDPDRGIIVLTRQAGAPNEGAFYVAHDGTVLASREAVPAQAIPATYHWRGASTGVVVLTKHLLASSDPGARPTSLEKTLLPALIAARRLRAYDNGTRYFLDFGTPERLAQLHHDTHSNRIAFPLPGRPNGHGVGHQK